MAVSLVSYAHQRGQRLTCPLLEVVTPELAWSLSEKTSFRRAQYNGFSAVYCVGRHGRVTIDCDARLLVIRSHVVFKLVFSNIVPEISNEM